MSAHTNTHANVNASPHINFAIKNFGKMAKWYNNNYGGIIIGYTVGPGSAHHRILIETKDNFGSSFDYFERSTGRSGEKIILDKGYLPLKYKKYFMVDYDTAGIGIVLSKNELEELINTLEL